MKQVNEPKVEKVDPMLVEALAFRLLYAKRVDQECDTVAVEQLALDTWQDVPSIRATYRELARHMLEILEGDGLRVRVGDSRAAQRQMTWLQTIPPRAAYDLAEVQTQGED